MHTHQALRIAVGDNAKAVREALRRRGKRVSLRWVYYQCEPAEDVARTDVYGAFWRLFRAVWEANRDGGEFLFEDFRARVMALRERDSLVSLDWYEQVARCEEEHAQALKAAILARDSHLISKELAEDIAAKRQLLAMAEARCRESERRAA
jgi:hypothetical protein